MFQTDGFCILPAQRCASAGSSYGLVSEPHAAAAVDRRDRQTDGRTPDCKCLRLPGTNKDLT